MHGAGVGGGSLGYANVLEIPTDETFATPAWNQPIAWGQILKPHYETAKKMLGAARNPKLWKADDMLKQFADERGMSQTFRATEVGAYFGDPNQTVPDPYFGGEGPARGGCNQCGGCMVGCRYNAKNTLPKNYLYFAEKNGAEIISEAEVIDVAPLHLPPNATASDLGGVSRPKGVDEGGRYEVIYQTSTSPSKRKTSVRANNVIFSAGVMGTIKFLLNLADAKKSLPNLSPRLGDMVPTNSEAVVLVLFRANL